MNIRIGKKTDIKQLIILDKKANKEIKWWSPLNRKDFIKIINKKMLYVAESKKEIFGYLSGTNNNKKLILDNIFVKREYRNKGIAVKLINKFIRDNKNFEAVRLDCPERLRSFYEKLGFKITAIIMQKKL